MPAECAAHFVRTPALRGNAAAGLLRMMAQDSIARPSMRGAHQAAELWISELAEADEVLLEYFTAEEPEMHAEAPSPLASVLARGPHSFKKHCRPSNVPRR